jgi:photoactive yellow protein
MSDTMTQTAWTQGTRMADSGAGVADQELLALIDSLTPDQIDELPFGVVRTDDVGLVEFYSQGESRISGVPVSSAEGRNFFTSVAACTNNKLFRGTFTRGVEEGEMNLVFFYTFTYKMSPTEVKVQFFKRQGGANWILVAKK